jgi:hypothetical protein
MALTIGLEGQRHSVSPLEHRARRPRSGARVR